MLDLRILKMWLSREYKDADGVSNLYKIIEKRQLLKRDKNVVLTVGFISSLGICFPISYKFASVWVCIWQNVGAKWLVYILYVDLTNTNSYSRLDVQKWKRCFWTQVIDLKVKIWYSVAKHASFLHAEPIRWNSRSIALLASENLLILSFFFSYLGDILGSGAHF